MWYFINLFSKVYFGLSPCPVTVTTRIVMLLVGGPCKPSFATDTGRGANPRYIRFVLCFQTFRGRFFPVGQGLMNSYCTSRFSKRKSPEMGPWDTTNISFIYFDVFFLTFFFSSFFVSNFVEATNIWVTQDTNGRPRLWVYLPCLGSPVNNSQRWSSKGLGSTKCAKNHGGGVEVDYTVLSFHIFSIWNMLSYNLLQSRVVWGFFNKMMLQSKGLHRLHISWGPRRCRHAAKND